MTSHVLPHDVRQEKTMEQKTIEKYAQRLIEITSQMAQLPDDRQSLGYGKGQRRIIFYLHQHPEGVPSGELSKQLHVGTGRIGNALKELEKKGYITRRNDEKDGRVVLVFPTAKGHEFAQERRKEFFLIIENALEAVGEEKFTTFLDIYTEIVEAQNKAFGKEKRCSNSTQD